MTQMAELTTQVLARGTQTKFTPERIQQIKNLVEGGKSREEIAELIGVTLGSLQVSAQGWGSACGDLLLTLEPVCCGETNRVPMGPPHIVLVVAVTAGYRN
jgi:hypothetical protein